MTKEERMLRNGLLESKMILEYKEKTFNNEESTIDEKITAKNINGRIKE